MKIVFNKIKSKSDNDEFHKFLTYFEDTYLKLCDYKKWNYFSQPRFATNNALEAYNSKINNFFNNKATYFKLVFELLNEEADIINTYNKRKSGLLGSNNRRIIKAEKFISDMKDNIDEIMAMPNNTTNDKKNRRSLV